MTVTLARPHGSRAATVAVPGGTEYVVKENGTVDVHEDHVHHLKAAGFVHPSQLAAQALEINSEAGEGEQSGAAAPGSQNTDQEPTDEFSKMNLAQLGEWLKANGASDEQIAAIKSKKDGRAAARKIVADKAKDPLS